MASSVAFDVITSPVQRLSIMLLLKYLSVTVTPPFGIEPRPKREGQCGFSNFGELVHNISEGFNFLSGTRDLISGRRYTQH